MAQEGTVLVCRFTSIAAAGLLYKWVISNASNSQVMNEFSAAIQEGSRTYLQRFFQALGLLAIVAAGLMFVLVGWGKSVAYLLGAVSSATAAYIGMHVATRANASVAWAARSGRIGARATGSCLPGGECLFELPAFATQRGAPEL